MSEFLNEDEKKLAELESQSKEFQKQYLVKQHH